MDKNKEFVFASSVFEEEKAKPKTTKKSATVKKQFIFSEEYHETYY